MLPIKRAGGLKPSREEKLPALAVERASPWRSLISSTAFSGLLPLQKPKKGGGEAQKEQLNGQPLLASMDAHFCPQN
jgi:hypothetical protein